MAGTAALRIHIEGRVQGVGYRYWLIGQAAVSGPQEALDEILRRCHEGPALARVDRVAVEAETAWVKPGFHALPMG